MNKAFGVLYFDNNNNNNKRQFVSRHYKADWIGLIATDMSLCSNRPVSRNVVWGRPVSALEWRRRGVWGWGYALHRKMLACSPSKWCILMHGTRFIPNIIATMMFMSPAEV